MISNNQNLLCGLCLDYDSDHKSPQYPPLQEIVSKMSKKDLFFKSKCGHYQSKICFVEQYMKCFEIEMFDNEIKYNNSSNQTIEGSSCFTCNFCNTRLTFEEVKDQLYGIITQIREKRSKFTCLICYETDMDRDCYSISLTECDHIFCVDCIRSFVIQNINNLKFRYEDMKCPQDGCAKPINNFIVDRLICNSENMNIYNRMCRLQLSNFVLNEKNTKVTQCPGFFIRKKDTNEEIKVEQEVITLFRLGEPPKLKDDEEIINCPVFFSFNTKNVKQYDCKICNYKSCLKGCEDYHPPKSKRGKSCKDFQKWKQLNQKLDTDIRAILDQETICQCPQCKAIIIRNGGCNHMTCTMPNCGFEFCFKCESKWLCWTHFHYF